MKQHPDCHSVSTVVSTGVGEYLARFRDPERFIAFCRACGSYRACWSCPPFDFDADAYLGRYRTAWLIGTQIFPDAASLSAGTDDSVSFGREIIRRARRPLDDFLLSLEKKYAAGRAFFAGTCLLCPPGECSRRERRPCLHPERVRPSLEAFGLDLERTAAEYLGIRMQWSYDGELPAYFTLVSGFFTDETIPTNEWENL